MSFKQIAGACGLLAAILLLVPAFATPLAPGLADPMDRIASYFGEHRNALVLRSALRVASVGFGLVFAVGLWAMLRPAETERGEAWSTVGLAGSVGAAAMTIAVAAGTLALSIAVDDKALSGSGAYVMFALVTALRSFSGCLVALSLIGFSVSAYRSKALPDWVLAAGVFAAAGNVVGIAGAGTTVTRSYTIIAFGAVLLGTLWSVVVALMMVWPERRASEVSDSEEEPVPTA